MLSILFKLKMISFAEMLALNKTKLYLHDLKTLEYFEENRFLQHMVE